MLLFTVSAELTIKLAILNDELLSATYGLQAKCLMNSALLSFVFVCFYLHF